MGNILSGSVSETDFLTAVHDGRETVALQYLKENPQSWASARCKEGMGPLAIACQNGHLSLVKEFVKLGAQPDQANEAGQTSLHWAATRGYPDIVELLLSCGASIDAEDKEGFTPFLKAVESGEMGVVDLLISKECDKERTTKKGDGALGLASKEGHVEIAEKLVSWKLNYNGHHADGYTPLHYAACHGHVNLTEYLLSLNRLGHEKRDNDGLTPFLRAVQSRQKDLVAILAQKCKIHAREKSTDIGALALASKNGDIEMIRKLIELKVIVNETDKCGNTPLHWAIKTRHADAAKFLVENGALTNLNDENGSSSLHLAVKADHLDLAEFLIEKGAIIDADDMKGRTSLHLASDTGCLDIVKCLVTKRADVDAQDKKGCTSLHLAAIAGHQRVVEYLVASGADIETQDELGLTPFLCAVSVGQVGLVGALMTNKCNIHAKNKQNQGGIEIAEDKKLSEMAKKLEGFHDAYDAAVEDFFGHRSQKRSTLLARLEESEELFKKEETKRRRAEEGGEQLLDAFAFQKENVQLAVADYRTTLKRAMEAESKLQKQNEQLQLHINDARGLRKLKTVLEKTIHENVEALEKSLRQYEEKNEEVALLRSHNKELLAKSESHLKQAKDAEDSLYGCNETESELRKINSTLRQVILDNGNEVADWRRQYEGKDEEAARLSKECNRLRDTMDQQRVALERQVNALTERVNHLTKEKEESRELRELEDALRIFPEDIKTSDTGPSEAAYGEMAVGHWRGCTVAVKSFDELLGSDYHQQLFCQEIAVRSRLRHPHITTVFGIIFMDGRPKKIVTSFSEASLSDVIKAAQLSLRERIDLAVGFTSGVSFLHQLQGSLPIILGDIRSSNILVTRLMEAQVCDLGTARFIESSLSAGTRGPEYLAPERLEGGGHSSTNADVYSLGVTLIELMIQEQPIQSERRGQVERVDHPEVKSLCIQMIDQIPSSRPSAPDCLNELRALCDSDEYKRCPPKRMVKGKQHGNKAVELTVTPWC